jgi:aryl-alcohol dehydrogenase-like predicted oxidoreductase
LNGTLNKIKSVCKEVDLPMSTVALSWVMQNEQVCAVLCGARTRQQIEENAKAVEQPLSPEIMERLNEITLPIKRILGPSPDLWQSPEDSRFR